MHVQGEEKNQSDLKKQIAAELEWVQSNAKGQQKKGKARLRSFEDIKKQVGSHHDLLKSIFCHINNVSKDTALSSCFEIHCMYRGHLTEQCQQHIADRMLVFCRMHLCVSAWS